MKAMLLLAPLAFAGLANGASADEENCTKQFQACTVTCVTGQPTDRQDACILACEKANTACFSAVFKERAMRSGDGETVEYDRPGESASAAVDAASAEPAVEPEASLKLLPKPKPLTSSKPLPKPMSKSGPLPRSKPSSEPLSMDRSAEQGEVDAVPPPVPGSAPAKG